MKKKDPKADAKGDRKGRSIKDKGQKKSGRLAETLYNCPYLIAVSVTAILVMIRSDQIGVKAIAREFQGAAERIESCVSAETGGPNMENPDPVPDREAAAAETDSMEIDPENTDSINQNEGTCKDEKDETTNDKELNNDNADGEDTAGDPENSTENTGNIGKSEIDSEKDTPKGVTRFELYAPQEIDSYYYSDAGKVALTTEYPYAKENISYFNDAAFLGDSRTLGISDYAGLDEADFYCENGMTIYKILEPEGVTYQKTGDKVDLSQVLKQKRYGKIYIMLGMNELGYGNTAMYLEQYRAVVEQIKEWQPGAVIYIMANLHVSREMNNLQTEFNNININDKNAAAALLANGTDVFYLDANPLFTDAEGFLDSELTFDGVHLYAKHYDVWRDFLMEHAVQTGDAAGEDAAQPEGAGGEDAAPTRDAAGEDTVQTGGAAGEDTVQPGAAGPTGENL